MAINIKNSNYNGEVLEQLLTVATTNNEIVSKGLIHVIPNLSRKSSVTLMVTFPSFSSVFFPIFYRFK